MTKVRFLPHESLCPEGKEVEVAPGTSVLDAALDHGIALEHACERACACTTCHVIVKEGYSSLGEPSETEDDLLDKAWGLTTQSRLGCQALVEDTDLTVELPKYTLNHAAEEH